MTTAATDTNRRGIFGKPQEVADYLLTTAQNLAKMRWQGRGPRYTRVGKAIRYRWDDVDAWLEANSHGGGTKSA